MYKHKCLLECRRGPREMLAIASIIASAVGRCLEHRIPSTRRGQVACLLPTQPGATTASFAPLWSLTPAEELQKQLTSSICWWADKSARDARGVDSNTPILHIVSWEPEGRYCRSKMFRWEPEGRYCHWLCTAIAPFWFSMEHLWAAITPSWLSTDDILLSYYRSAESHRHGFIYNSTSIKLT